jgi:hypothetical protein
MKSLNKISKTTPYRKKAPSSFDISFIIILGISGMLGTFQYLLGDLKMNPYKKEVWAVKDLPGVTVDSLTVVYHPLINIHQADLKNSRVLDKKSKTPVAKVNTEKTIDFKSIYFAYNSVFLVWIAIFSVLVGCSLGLLPVIISEIRSMVRIFRLPLRRQVVVFLLTILIGGLIYFTQHIAYLMKPSQILDKFQILLYNPYLINIFVIISIGVALTAIAGQLLINQAISSLPVSIVGLDLAEQNKIADKFSMLRKQLKLFLLIDAVLIVFSVLNTDAFRRAIVAEVSVSMDILPKNYVYLYGVLFTFFLAIIYMPIYYRLKLKGELMLKEIPKVELEADCKDLAAILNIEQTPIESLKVVLSILAPVLTSLVPGMLNI